MLVKVTELLVIETKKLSCLTLDSIAFPLKLASSHPYTNTHTPPFGGSTTYRHTQNRVLCP